jgi:hypothetical protein
MGGIELPWNERPCHAFYTAPSEDAAPTTAPKPVLWVRHNAFDLGRNRLAMLRIDIDTGKHPRVSFGAWKTS